MISFIRGTVAAKEKDSLIVETSGGVGYEIRMTLLQLTQYSIGQLVAIHTFLKVSENAMDLYGFENLEQKAFFELLMTVSGVGPKSAMNILSLGNMEQIQAAIGRGDVTYLTSVQGLGKKTAERIVVELKGKITTSDKQETTEEESSVLAEVIDGLMALGYTKEEAKYKTKGIELKGKTTQQVLKLALKNK